jgi:hypothetical protein
MHKPLITYITLETCTIVPIKIIYTMIFFYYDLLIPHLPTLIKLYKMLYSSAKRTLYTHPKKAKFFGMTLYKTQQTLYIMGFVL